MDNDDVGSEVMADLGYVPSEPERNRRIRQLYGLEDSVDQHSGKKTRKIVGPIAEVLSRNNTLTSSGLETAMLIVDLEPTFPNFRNSRGEAFRKKDHISKKEYIGRLRRLRALGFDELESGYDMTPQQIHAYFNSIRNYIIRNGASLVKAS